MADTTHAPNAAAGQELLRAPGALPISRIPTIRYAPSGPENAANLGLLGELEGSWEGNGFNLIARPDKEGNADLFLELNLTHETLKFDSIGSVIPNRGFAQNDLDLFGLTYLQKIRDSTTGGALHIEPGIWVNVPSTTAPVESASVARMATIPHGNAVLAEGTAFKVNGPPVFDKVNTAPFGVGAPMPAGGTRGGFPQYTLTNPVTPANPRTPFGNPAPFTTLPPQITQAVVDDPNIFLQDAILGQTIVETTVLQIATVKAISAVGGPKTTTNGGGGIENLPFLVDNANTVFMFATFWIEKVVVPGGHFLQLQYVQTVMLNFPILNTPVPHPNLSWPHVSVATLTKSFG